MTKTQKPKKDYKFFASFARLLKQFNPSLFVLGFITISIVVVLSILFTNFTYGTLSTRFLAISILILI